MTGLTLDGIVRVSKTGEREYLRSPDQQKAALYRWAKEHGHELASIHVAIDESARKGAHPAIERAKARALNGEVDGVVAPYLSRFTRNTLYGLTTVRELLEHGKYFFSVSDLPFDLKTPEGMKYLTEKLAEAQYESDVRAGNFALGVEEAIARGVHLGIPYGYRRSNGKGSPLALVKEEAKQVKRAFELRAEGMSWAAIAAELNASGPKPRPYKRDGKVHEVVWTHKAVRQLVANEVYTGVAFNGAHRLEEAHPAIVSRELYEKANRTKGTKPLRPKEGYLLSGLVRCAGCGYAMTCAADTNGRYYRCRSTQHGRGRCSEPASANADELEAIVTAAFASDFLSGKAIAIPDGTVAEATLALERAQAAVEHTIGLYALLGAGASEEAKAAAGSEVTKAEAGLREAKSALQAAKAAALGADLPDWLDANADREAALPDRRHWRSLAYGVIVVRKGLRWREPVGERVRLIARSEVPTGRTELIGFVRGLDMSPT